MCFQWFAEQNSKFDFEHTPLHHVSFHVIQIKRNLPSFFSAKAVVSALVSTSINHLLVSIEQVVDTGVLPDH